MSVLCSITVEKSSGGTERLKLLCIHRDGWGFLGETRPTSLSMEEVVHEVM